MDRVLAYETGVEFLHALRQATNGELQPCILVVEGIVGCAPAHPAEGIGLSAPVARAVGDAIELILDIIRREGDADIEGA
jgi:hypothetical protein